ncbi:Serine-type D-Ala-D-Ala carboxypeptidase [Methylocella tundrae]|uniref:Serine-type D-Ala-D-Ala carboxypeptidase n=1 Tax=Methylocella tundrae TaxID=227605 RepID=A0A8B6M5M7_METTU|nr:serine hydrolase [Methylocella tundrae]VTZ49689.1 Serine-type D-Ala-D-Ala carboxypeptidase [Methylocella tundrae]
MLTLGATVRRMMKGDALSALSMAMAASCVLATSVAVTGLTASPAEARHRPHVHHAARHFPRHFARESHSRHSVRYMRARTFAPSRNFAAIVVDGNSGETLYARNDDEPRHPASITKVMTLYLLFEQLEQGRLRLDSELRVSAHAAAQKPTKLGLRPGRTITVEDAIKAVVTRSANDMAVAIAEAIGGDEDHFAEMMTRKAHELGMNHTRYVNASGLPDDAQITTARDLSILGRAVQERFPRYYHYFSTRAFYYAGATIMNHNHLMDRVEGMDGIKTGYTRASGFNLLTSVKRDGHYIVAVVMGGVSAPSRDRIMADLIDDQIDHGKTVRTASVLSDLPPRPQETEAARPDLPTLRAPAPQEAQQRPQQAPKAALAYVEPEATAAANASSKLALSAIAPKPARAIDPIRVASISPEVPVEKPRPAYVSGAVRQSAAEARPAAKDWAAKAAALDGSTIHAAYFAPPSATPSTLRWVTGPAPAKDRKFEKPNDRTAALSVETAPSEKLKAAEKAPEEARRPAAARTGWMIQIGATDDIAKANALLVKAKADGRKTLSSAQPFTEKVQKGSETLYRARFAGLEADSAELACKTLKRTGFSCFATKN